MYEVGTCVFHTHCGVCLIQEIAPLPGDDSGLLYYVLSPYYGDDKDNIVRVPVDGSTSLRRPLDREQAMKLISEWPDVNTDLYLVDSKKRKQAYETALRSGYVEDLAILMEGAFQRKARDGHLNSMDAQFVAKAQPIVYGELGFALGVPIADVPAYIREHARKPIKKK